MPKPTPHLAYRQVHLDFHTSGAIPEVGHRFDKYRFQAALQAGHVNAITLFSKCHHGYSYHQTDVGMRHPGLRFNLLDEQLEACAEINVDTAIYISVAIDELRRTRQPEEQVQFPEKNPLRAGFRRVCLNTPYLDYLEAQTAEVVTRYRDAPTRGVFFDIFNATPCRCGRCLAEMDERGLDPDNPEDLLTLGRDLLERGMTRLTRTVERARPHWTIFHNLGHVPRGNRRFEALSTHLELESLPTGGWGYDHFAISARYAAANTGERLFIGQTGKFHTAWGEFGGFKHPNALRYECALINAYGGRCGVGDQLHPDGEMNADTYRSIGLAYAEVEQREPFLLGARPLADVGVVSHEAIFGDQPSPDHSSRTNYADKGLSRVLTELGVLHDFIDGEADFGRYKVVVLPDTDPLPAPLIDRLRTYLEAGGRILLAFRALLDAESGQPWLAAVGRLTGPSPHDVNYIQLGEPTFRAAEAAGQWFPQGPFRGPAQALLLKPARGTRVPAGLHRPYFNRTRRQFCSHRNTPDCGPTNAPAVVVGRNFAWLAAPLFTAYADEGQRLYRDLVGRVLAELLPVPTVETSLPSQGKVALTEQLRERRYVLHLIYGSPIKRGGMAGLGRTQGDIEVIEDLPPIHDVTVRVRPPRSVRTVTLQPQATALDFATGPDGAVTFTVPRLECAQLVELAWARARRI